MRPAERLLDRLEGVRATGEGKWQARCPGHDDRNPSLTVTEKANGDVLLHDHAGCSIEDIVAAVELTMADLFAENGNGRRDIEAVYSYVDEGGKPLFEVVRFAGKEFRQRRPDGTWKLNGVRRVLYRLPRVLEAVERGEDIMVVEGEKDVHALERLGIAATTNSGGAGKWREEYSETLRGAKVTIVADKDEPGYAHARAVAAALEGVAAEIDVVECTKGKDILRGRKAPKRGREVSRLTFPWRARQGGLRAAPAPPN
jgi:putative DNA primase/helicase